MSNFNKYVNNLKKDAISESKTMAKEKGSGHVEIGYMKIVPCVECGKAVETDLSGTCRECNQKRYE